MDIFNRMNPEKKLSITPEKNGNDGVIHRFAGRIDEHAVFSSISIISPLVFDLDGVESMNSIGVMNWVKYFKSIPPDVTIYFERIPRHIVEQINMLSRMFFGGKTVIIRSIRAPYYCESCDITAELVLDIPADQKLSLAPQKTCNTCKSTMLFDQIEEDYFKFLSADG